ncbi:MAG TPA: ABC transporter ATP-binding protein [Syntrophomonadaceae bacterium]|nr:ABC transporter ATP-binding protein [Syntrophomonadaceae bacterium]
MFSLKDVGFCYQKESRLFNGVTLNINAGESVCLLGANGSGKSTLLKIFCGLVFPSAGTFCAFGEEINEDLLEDDFFAKQYHRRVGFVFQNSDAQLFTTRVWDEIAFGPLQVGINSDEVRKRVNDVVTILHIEDLVNRSPYRLSGGEKKKVAFASVLVMNPEVLIMDEPTNGLDPKTQRWLTELIIQLNGAGRTIITATHNLELAHAISRRALVLAEDHQVVGDGPTHAILEDRELLIQVNLIDEYSHVHGSQEHIHRYTHG